MLGLSASSRSSPSPDPVDPVCARYTYICQGNGVDFLIFTGHYSGIQDDGWSAGWPHNRNHRCPEQRHRGAGGEADCCYVNGGKVLKCTFS